MFAVEDEERAFYPDVICCGAEGSRVGGDAGVEFIALAQYKWLVVECCTLRAKVGKEREMAECCCKKSIGCSVFAGFAICLSDESRQIVLRFKRITLILHAL